MADLALGGPERIFKACLAIKKAVATVKHNKKDCREIQRCVDRITDLLSWLQELTSDAVTHPSFTGPLDDLAESMEEALQVINDCQQRSAVRHLIQAGEMAKKLRRVHGDIQHKLLPAIFATNIRLISVSVTNTLYVGTDPLPLLPQRQPQVAGEVNSYDGNFSAIEMRPGVNSNTTMVATGNAVPYASSSTTGLTELNSSWESALHLSSEENIITGGHSFLLKQKIVIKLAMASAKSRNKAMQLASKAAGVSSVAITGDGKDRVEVVGECVDCVYLIHALRKKVGHADLVKVEEGAHPGNRKLPARQRFIHPSEASSLDSDESSLSSRANKALPAPAAQAHHDAALPVPSHVAALERQDAGPSSRGRTAHLRDAAADLHEWLAKPVMPAYGIIFVLVFLLFLGIVTSRNF